MATAETSDSAAGRPWSGRLAAALRRPLGWRIYGLGLIHMAVVALALGAFLPGEAVPKGFPGRAELAYGAAAILLAGGAAIQWRRTAAWAGAALAAYFGVVVILAMDARLVLAHPTLYLVYESLAEQLALAAGGLLVYAAFADPEHILTARLTRAGQLAFGLCAVVFGGAHFAYMNLTAPLVPKWLPPSQLFWGYATGVFQIAGGAAILAGVRPRLAALLLTLMYALFTPLVHLPRVIADPSNAGAWIENATNLALIGVAWLVADSLARKAEPAALAAAAAPA